MRAFIVVLLVCVSCFAALSEASKASDRIKNVVVVMLENRSFDHRLGYFHQTLNKEIDGIKGNEVNLLNVTDPNGVRCTVNDKGDPNGTPNAGHSYHSTINEQYGTKDIKPPYPEPPMSGFAFNEHNCNVMHSIPVKDIPVTQSILENYAVVDRYFASFPGPTEVNRMFWHSGTSDGFCDNPKDEMYVEGFKQESLLHRLSTRNVSWGVYMGDDVSTTLFFRDQRNAEALKNYHSMDKFHKDAADGKLPTYTVIEPRYVSIPSAPANDEHPSGHTIYQGELLYKSIYDSVRNSPQWNNTAFFIIYDEHGGLYDHVPSPTQGVPAPSKGLRCTYGGDPYFDFTRLGVRVPAYVISPWVEKMTVVHDPVGKAAPTNTSRYDHSSIIRTVFDLFVSPNETLTERDRWAGSFAPLFETLDQPRGDCPKEMPMPPQMSMEEKMRNLGEWMQPVNDWQLSLVKGYAAMTGKALSSTELQALRTEKDVQAFLTSKYKQLRQRVGLN